MIPRVDYRILLGTRDQGTDTYDHLRGLAIHARAINPALATEERGWGELARWSNGAWVVRRNFAITAGGIEDGPSPGLGNSDLWQARGMMAFPDLEHAENAYAHVEALAQQGAAVLVPADVAVLGETGRASTGMLHLCRHEVGGACEAVDKFAIPIEAPSSTAWEPGTDYLDGGEELSHAGEEWRNRRVNNTQQIEPGADDSGWMQISALPAPWYFLGNEGYPLDWEVTHGGQTWRNTGMEDNFWEPGVFGWTVV